MNNLLGLKYDIINQKIIQDWYSPDFTRKTESMMALGNGYIGLRSVDEEMDAENKEDLFVNGVFNKANNTAVPELANLADLIQTPISIGGFTFNLHYSFNFSKELSLKTGLLVRRIQFGWGDSSFELKFERFVSQAKKHVYCQRIRIKQLSGKPVQVIFNPRINGQTTNSGAQHFIEGTKTRPTPTSIQYFESTNQSIRFVGHNMITNGYVNGSKVPIVGGDDDYVVTMGRRRVGFQISGEISIGKSFTLEKLMSVNTSVDLESKTLDFNEVKARTQKLHEYLQKTTFDKEFKKSSKAWDEIWNQFQISIESNKSAYDAQYDNLALNFSIYHMNSFVPKNNINLSIGAKGLSGEGYLGHTFWDTEFYVFPSYLYTKPEIARNLLAYRYLGIDGARAKAKEMKQRPEESNLEGAQYPWETGWPTDGEVCPYWGQADIVTGKQVPIASRRQEIHVSSTIAYAVHQYYDFTNDEKFMEEMGYEMVIDTAIFWANRAELQTDGRYAYLDIMGPNEYKGDINNNAYTNAMAKWNLDKAIYYISKLNQTEEGQKIFAKITRKIPYKIDIDKMILVSDKLIQQLPDNNGIINENDWFKELPRNDVSKFQLRGDSGKKLFKTRSGLNCLSGQIVKQADVVLLTYLMPHKFGSDIIEKNFRYYEPITTHDSSLSATTHCIQAVELRDIALAYKLYKYSINIDLGSNMRSCDDGIHAGSIAAIWQSTVFGFGGLRWWNNQMHINPMLPWTWTRLAYNFIYKGAKISVVVTTDAFSVHVTNGKRVTLHINNEAIPVDESIQEFEIRKEPVKF